MSGCCEYGKCEVCGKEGILIRTYFRYDIQCECHSPNHYEMVRHCPTCVPSEPEVTKIHLKTSTLTRIES